MLRRRRSPLQYKGAGAEQDAEGYEQCRTDVGRSADTADEVEVERRAYEQKRVRDGTERVIGLFFHLYPLFFFTVLATWCSGQATSYEFLCLQVPFGVMMLAVKFYRRHALKNMTNGLAFQSAFWILVTLVESFSAFSMRTELLRHRYFLTFFIPSFAIFSVVAYIPHVYVLFFCLWSFVVWLLFHHAVGFMNIPCATDGLLGSAFAYYAYTQFDRLAWLEFKATQDLDKERQFLQAMHDTLQGMLCSLFDASCTCDQSGAVLSFTPHLRDLLGGNFQDGPSLHLRELAASTAEANRLQHFLEQICCQRGSHRAQTIQASLQAATQASGIREVKLFGIMLPDQPGKLGGQGSSRIFIGLQGQGNPVSMVDVSAVQSVVTQEEELDTSSPKEASLAVLQIPRKWGREEDFAGSDVGSLSFTKTHSHSETATFTTTITSGLSKHVQTEEPEVNSAQEPRQHSLAALQDTSVQTEAADALGIHLQCPHCCLPQPGLDFSREQACFENWRATRKGTRKIRLNSSKRVHNDFLETPDATLKVVLMEVAKTINACGQGCCTFHIIAGRLAQVLTAFRSLDCPRDFSPHSDWQCHHCKAMNEAAHPDLEDEAELCCSTCDTEREDWQPSASSDSGANADLENDQAES